VAAVKLRPISRNGLPMTGNAQQLKSIVMQVSNWREAIGYRLDTHYDCNRRIGRVAVGRRVRTISVPVERPAIVTEPCRNIGTATSVEGGGSDGGDFQAV
jgi:hypothetical protein